MISLLVLAAVKVASEVATVKLMTMGIGSALSIYTATRPRAYQRPSKKK